MNLASQILSDITVHMKYARYIPELNRRETWDEIVTRNKNMHLKKFPDLADEIEEAYTFVYDKKILPSMRSLQFGGKPIEISPNRIYNCSFAPIDDWRVFHEIMFLLLGGTGVGISVQRHHVEQLPEIVKPNPQRKRRFLIGDSIEGWADAVKVLMKSYFFGGSTIIFDFDDIRPKGARLVTSGGKAPGPQPLKECLVKIRGILDEKNAGDQLKPIEAYDIVCHIADAVLAGGIRRAALITLFSATDIEMLTAKSGNWSERNPQRARSNNSAVLLRSLITKKFFDAVWDRIIHSGSGEPGVYFTNDKEWGANPCVEIGLRPFQFCNLVTINSSSLESQIDFNDRARAAAFIATLQASYTDFHYLRPVWQRTTEKEALIGVSLTGIADKTVYRFNKEEAAIVVKSENSRTAKLIGINTAARTTCGKPEGTSSLVLGSSSGWGRRSAKRYIRRLRIGKNESLYPYLLENHPELVEDEYFSPHDTAVISVPQESPWGAITEETALEFMERIKEGYLTWVKPGHRSGLNTNNISATVFVKPKEWESVGNWMWENREYYCGLTVLPHDGGTYKQMPFEECDKDTYDKMFSVLQEIDLTKIVELSDNTDLKGEIACSGGSCELV